MSATQLVVLDECVNPRELS